MTRTRRVARRPLRPSQGRSGLITSMNERHTLIAFMSVVAAIVALALIGGTGSDLAIMTGLIGVLGTFRPRTIAPDVPQAVTVANTARDPVPVEAAE